MQPMYKLVATLPLVLMLFGNDSFQNADVMKSLTVSVGKKYLECQELMYLNQTILDEFLNYWESRDGPHEMDTGCALLCISQRLELLDDEGRLKETNARWFLSSGDADNYTISKVLELCYKCGGIAAEKPTEHVCMVAVEVAKCFRSGIQALGWTPDVSDLKTPQGFRRFYFEDLFLKLATSDSNTLINTEDRQKILDSRLRRSGDSKTSDGLDVRGIIRSSITRRCDFYPS